ncbi:MAG: hypothetical protein ABIG89_03475 [Candidatus Woesearchaeota archaeon]
MGYNQISKKVLIFLVICFILPLIYADGPGLPHTFKGTCQFVNNAGTINCTIGTLIKGYIDYATDSTTEDTVDLPYRTIYSGEYGNLNGKDSGDSFGVNYGGDTGKEVNFTINGIMADQSYTTDDCDGDVRCGFDNGEISTLALTVTDTTLPTVDSVVKANNSYMNSTDQLTIQVSDNSGTNSLLYNIGGSNTSFSNNTAFTPGFSTEGNNYFYIYVEDKLNNTINVTYNYSYDATAPAYKDMGPTAAQSTTASSLHVTLWTTMQEVSTCAYGTSNSSFGALTLMNTSDNLNFTANLTYTADASAVLYVKCNDSAGNINVDGNTTSFSVDVSTGASTGSTGGGGGGGSGSTDTTMPISTPTTPAPISMPSVPSSEGGEGAPAPSAPAPAGGAGEGGASEGGAGEGTGVGDEAGAGDTEDKPLAGKAFEALAENFQKTKESVAKAFTALKSPTGSKVFSLTILVLLIVFLVIVIKRTKKHKKK